MRWAGGEWFFVIVWTVMFCLLQVIMVWTRCGKPQQSLWPSPCTSLNSPFCALWSTKRICSQTPTSWPRQHFLLKASAQVGTHTCCTAERARALFPSSRISVHYTYFITFQVYLVFYLVWDNSMFSKEQRKTIDVKCSYLHLTQAWILSPRKCELLHTSSLNPELMSLIHAT